MKNRFFILSTAVLILCIALIYAEDSPMSRWTFKRGAVTLNGETFLYTEYPKSWREQEGYALVQGFKTHYWLYDTYTYHNGNDSDIMDDILPAWVENMGYVIDYDNHEHISSANNVPSSVKALMSQRRCDVAVTLTTNSTPHKLVITSFSKNKNSYFLDIYPLYKGNVFYDPVVEAAINECILRLGKPVPDGYIKGNAAYARETEFGSYLLHTFEDGTCSTAWIVKTFENVEDANAWLQPFIDYFDIKGWEKWRDNIENRQAYDSPSEMRAEVGCAEIFFPKQYEWTAGKWAVHVFFAVDFWNLSR
ncbi:hypothetical protein [Treponema socranskii]